VHSCRHVPQISMIRSSSRRSRSSHSHSCSGAIQQQKQCLGRRLGAAASPPSPAWHSLSLSAMRPPLLKLRSHTLGL
jgi:hypothetical protein